MLWAWVFPSFLSVVQSKIVNSHRTDYNMLDEDIILCESTLYGSWWGSNSHCTSCGPSRECLEGCVDSFFQPLQPSSTQALCGHLLLWVQTFVFQLSLHIGFVKGKENIHIYLWVFAYIGTFIMVKYQILQNFLPPQASFQAYLWHGNIQIKLSMTLQFRENKWINWTTEFQIGS